MLTLKKTQLVIIVAAIALIALASWFSWLIKERVGIDDVSVKANEQQHVTIDLYTTVQLTHNSSTQKIVLEFENDDNYVLHVVNANGETLWNAEANLSHAGWNSLFLTRINREHYLMQYNPTTYQGVSAYSFRVFYLDENGNEVIIDKNEVEFSINPLGESDYFRNSDIEPVKTFYNHLNQYMSSSELLLSTDDYITSRLRLPENQIKRLYGTMYSPVFVEDYFFGNADMAIDEQMDMFIQYYTNEYEALGD